MKYLIVLSLLVFNNFQIQSSSQKYNQSNTEYTLEALANDTVTVKQNNPGSLHFYASIWDKKGDKFFKNNMLTQAAVAYLVACQCYHESDNHEDCRNLVQKLEKICNKTLKSKYALRKGPSDKMIKQCTCTLENILRLFSFSILFNKST